MQQSHYTHWHLPKGATIRFGKGKVNDVKFSADGKLLAVATYIGVWLYNAETGVEISLLRQNCALDTKHGISGVKILAFSTDGNSLACGKFNRTIDLWDVETYELKSTLPKLDSSVDTLQFFADDTKLAGAGGWDWDWGKGSTFLYELNEGTVEPVVPELDRIDADLHVTFSPDDKYIAAVSASAYSGRKKHTPAIQVWDIASQQRIFIKEKQEHNINALTFSPDGNTLAIAEGTKGIQLWNIESSTLVKTLNPEATSNTLTFSPDGNYLASGCPFGIVRLWDINNDNGSSLFQRVFSSTRGRPKHIFYADEKYSQFSTLAFSPDSKKVASANTNGTISCWDIDSKDKKYTITQHLSTIRSLAFNQNDLSDEHDKPIHNRILTSLNLGDSQVYISGWDVDKGVEISATMVDNNGEKTSEVTLSPDVSLFVTNDYSTNGCKVVRLWDAHAKRFLSTLGGQEEGRFEPEVVFSDDGKLLAVSSRKDNSIQLWDIPNRQTLCRFEGHTTNVYKLAISPDNKYVVSSGWTHKDETVRLWDAETGIQIASYPDQGSVAFSPDGNSFAAGCHIYSRSSNNSSYERSVSLEDISISQQATSFIFSPDGSILISSKRSGSIQLHDSTTGKIISTHTGHSSYVSVLLFSDDSSILASGSGDGTILLWDWQMLLSNTDISSHQQTTHI